MALARGPLRAQITKLVNQIDEHLASPSPGLTDLQVVMAQITEKFEHLKRLDETVLDAFDPDTQMNEFEEEFERASSYSDKVVRARTLVQNFERNMSMKQAQVVPSSAGSASTSSGNGNAGESTHPPYA